MAASDVWAQNAKGEKRRFTRMSWTLLTPGKDGSRDGWRELPDTIIHNTVESKKVTKPSTGEKKSQVIENTANKKTDQVIENTVNETVTPPAVSEEQKAEFAKATEGLKKGDIKDFFDLQDPKVEYSNSWKPQAFIEKLGEVLNYDIVALQQAFN